MDIDYYEVLGVPGNANDATIKAAFHRLVKKEHPDAFQGMKTELERKQVDQQTIDELIGRRLQEAEAKTRLLNEAYDVLSDREKRRAYHAAWKEAKTPKKPPKLVVKPDKIKIGGLVPGSIRDAHFTITNSGGELTDDLRITNWDKTPWISERSAVGDPDHIFPIQASFVIDTSELKPNTYNETIFVETVGSIAEVLVQIEVIAPATSKTPAASTASPSMTSAVGSATVTPKPFLARVVSWNSAWRFILDWLAFLAMVILIVVRQALGMSNVHGLIWPVIAVCAYLGIRVAIVWYVEAGRRVEKQLEFLLPVNFLLGADFATLQLSHFGANVGLILVGLLHVITFLLLYLRDRKAVSKRNFWTISAMSSAGVISMALAITTQSNESWLTGVLVPNLAAWAILHLLMLLCFDHN